MPTVDCHDAHMALVDMDRNNKVVVELCGDVHATDELKPKLEKMYPMQHFDSNFTKMFAKVSNILYHYLPNQEFAFLYGLATYVEFRSCGLVIGNTTARHYMTLRDIATEMELSYSRTTRTIKSLISKGLMAKIEVTEGHTTRHIEYYAINPYVYIYGDKPDVRVLQKFFEKSNWQDILKIYE